MKILWALCLILVTSAAFASSKKLGVGLMLGNPTGVNAKYWLGNGHAVDGGFGMSFGHEDQEGSLHSDYLLHKKSAFFLNDVHELDLYYGIGGRMEFADEIEVGVRVPVGLVHDLAGSPADMFVEVAPILDFLGTKGLELHLLIGSRYYF